MTKNDARRKQRSFFFSSHIPPARDSGQTRKTLPSRTEVHGQELNHAHSNVYPLHRHKHRDTNDDEFSNHVHLRHHINWDPFVYRTLLRACPCVFVWDHFIPSPFRFVSYSIIDNCKYQKSSITILYCLQEISSELSASVSAKIIYVLWRL